ncbi:MAG: hypothetical protein AB7T38_11820 [Nitrospirales bacterium]
MGPLVSLGHCPLFQCDQEWPGDNDPVGIDIFRFANNGRIVEHWDVLRVIPETSKNDNTKFSAIKHV